jgi:hypothetical protein
MQGALNMKSTNNLAARSQPVASRRPQPEMSRSPRRRIFVIVAALLTASVGSPHVEAVTTYRTVDVAAAIGHGPGWDTWVTRGDDTDVNLVTELGIHPAFANPFGSLSYKYVYNLPFGLLDSGNYLTATSTWGNFVVTGSTVEVREFEVTGTEVATYGTGGDFWSMSVASGGNQYIRTTFDGRMELFFNTNFVYQGPVAEWVGGNFATEVFAYGGYILNDVNTGLRFAQAGQFEFLGAGSDQAAADYLNFVAETHLPSNWTQAGLWYYGGEITEENSSGDFAPFYIGGQYWGYNVWYSTDTFAFGTPVGDPGSLGILSFEEVAGLVEAEQFADVGSLSLIGLKLAGEGFAQLFEVGVIAGEDALQTIVFEYDESLISPSQEPFLAIAHFVDGAWELPFQILDTDANTITVTLGSFSPFALVAPVPVPAAVWFMASGIGAMWVRRRHKRAGVLGV